MKSTDISIIIIIHNLCRANGKVTFYELSDFLEILTFSALRVGSFFPEKIKTSPMLRPEYIQ